MDKKKNVKVCDLAPEVNEILKQNFDGYKLKGFAHYGDIGCVLPYDYREHADAIYNFQPRPDDVWVVTYPRSGVVTSIGTTWTQELVWLLNNDLDFETARNIHLSKRFPFLELRFLAEKNLETQATLHAEDKPTYRVLDEVKTPRFIKSHLPATLLPPSLLDTCKVVYVARDPRDAILSYYRLCTSVKMHAFTGDFRTFWDLCRTESMMYSPYFPHVLEFWRQKNHHNLLFMFYDDLLHDLSGSIRRVAEFFEKQLSEKQVLALVEHLSFDTFRNNKAVDMFALDPNLVFKNIFFNKGTSGGWKESFDEEMMQQAEDWIADNLRDMNLKQELIKPR